MPQSRIYQPVSLSVDSELELDEAASHHLARVLRIQQGEMIRLFNGEGGEYTAKVVAIGKRKVTAHIQEFYDHNVESPLQLCLAQGISRGEKMDYTIQKAVELGVSHIFPLLTERCNVKLDDERKQKRTAHWQSIIQSACEQSGRNRIPTLAEPQTLTQWLHSTQPDYGFILAPKAPQKLHEFKVPATAKITLLIGPEGGLSDQEINQAVEKKFIPLSLGPRILRTETAAVAALTALQCFFGDLS